MVINHLKESGVPRIFSAGQCIFKRGQTSQLMYVVCAGEVDLLIGGRHLETVRPGGILDEAALQGLPHYVTAVARTDCELATFDQALLKKVVQRDRGFTIQVLQLVADRLHRLNGQLQQEVQRVGQAGLER